MQTVNIALEGHSYAIQVGHGILPDLGAHCQSLGLGAQVALIVDQAVAPNNLPVVEASLSQAGYQITRIVLSGGDEVKNLATAEEIYTRLIEAGLDRSAWIMALGGGGVGDLAGFVAATFLRGIDFVQVPTTIVSQVDASVGGKTGVDHPLGKNLIGAFHQPRLVYIDTDTLKTLPQIELVGGLGEVVKHAVIRDADLFTFLEENLEAIVARSLDPERLDWLIARNVQIKATVVEADPTETGLRAILNYGHTIGHAIEAATDYARYNHGQAVVLGMIGAGQIARLQGLWDAAHQQRQDALLQRLGIPPGLGQVAAERIVERTRSDKKRIGGRPKLVLGRRIGHVEIVDGLPEEAVRAGVDYIQQNYGATGPS